MGVIKLTKVAVRVWITSAGAHRDRALRRPGRRTAGQRAGCVTCRAAVTPAAVLAAVSADSPVEGCDAQYFCPLLGSYVSANIASCHRISRAPICCSAHQLEAQKKTRQTENSYARNIEQANRTRR
jgi:hypothetical protein